MSEPLTGGEGAKKEKKKTSASQKKLSGSDGKRHSGSDVLDMIEKIREEKEQEAKKRSISVSTPPVSRSASMVKAAPPLSLSASATTPTKQQRGKTKKRNSSNNFMISSPDYASFRNLADQLGGSPFDRAKQLGALPSPADHKGGGEPPTRPEKGVEGKLKSAFLSMRRKKKNESEQSGGPQSLTMLFVPPEPKPTTTTTTTTKPTEETKEEKASEHEKPKELPIEEKDLNKKKGTLRGKKGKGKGKEKRKGKGKHDKGTKDDDKEVPDEDDEEEFEELRNVFALALYDFDALPEHEYELSFKEGEIIKVTEKPPGDWWTGETTNGCGYFPHTFVKLLTPRTTDSLKLANASQDAAKDGKKRKGKKQKKREKKKGDKKKKKKEKKGESTGKGEPDAVADVIQTEDTEREEKPEKELTTEGKKEVKEQSKETIVEAEKTSITETAPEAHQEGTTQNKEEKEVTVEKKKEEHVEQVVKETEGEKKCETETLKKEQHVENDQNVPVQVPTQNSPQAQPEPERQASATQTTETSKASEPTPIESNPEEPQQNNAPQIVTSTSSTKPADSGPILGMGRGRGRVIQGKSRLGRTMRKGTDETVRVGGTLVAKTKALHSPLSQSADSAPKVELSDKPLSIDSVKASETLPSDTVASENTSKEEKDQPQQQQPENVAAENSDATTTPAQEATTEHLEPSTTSTSTTEKQGEGTGEPHVQSAVPRQMKHPRTRSTMTRVRTPAPLTQGTRKRASTDPDPEDPKKYDSVDRRNIDSKPIVLTSPPSSATGASGSSTLRPRPTPKILYKDPAKREAHRAASSPPVPSGGSVASIVNSLNSNVTVRNPSPAAGHHPATATAPPPAAVVGRGGPIVVGGVALAPQAGRGSPILPRSRVEGGRGSPLSHSTGSAMPLAGSKSLAKSAGPGNSRPKLHPVSSSSHPVNTHATPPATTTTTPTFIPPNTNIPVFNKALQMQNLNVVHKPTQQQQPQPQAPVEKREDIKFVPYAELKKRPAYLDCTKLESYLTDEEFQTVLKMTKEEFYKMAAWRQQRCKKEAGL